MVRGGVAASLLSRARRPRHASGLVVLASLAALAGCGAAPGEPSASSMPNAVAAPMLDVQRVAFELDRPAAQPSVVADPAGARFVLIWQERDAEGCAVLRTAVLPAGGDVGEPRDVARGCDWFVNWADFPSVVVADNGDWWTYYLQKTGASTYAYDIRLVRSEDEGRTWSAPITPHDDRTPTEHGFVSMVPMGGDRVLLAWLDGRNTLPPAPAAGHDAHGAASGGHAHAEGPMSLRSAEIGRDFVLRHEQEVDGRVCSCCPTDLVRRDDEAMLVYRDRSEDEIRDVHAAHYRDGRWRLEGAVRTDGWRIEACPVNGPALAASGDAVVSVWPTMASGPLEVKAAAISGTMGARVLEGGDGVLGRPDLASWGDTAWLAVWLGAGAERATALRAAVLDADLQPTVTRDLALLPPGRGTGMPRVASLGREAIVVWTEPKGAEGPDARVGTVQVRRLRH